MMNSTMQLFSERVCRGGNPFGREECRPQPSGHIWPYCHYVGHCG